VGSSSKIIIPENPKILDFSCARCQLLSEMLKPALKKPENLVKYLSKINI